MRKEAGDKLRVTIISPGFVRTNFTEGVTNPEVKAQLAASQDKFAMPSDAIGINFGRRVLAYTQTVASWFNRTF